MKNPKIKLGKIHPYHWRDPQTKKTEVGYQAEILIDGKFEDHYITIAPEEIGGNWPEEWFETETEERLMAMAKKMYEDMRNFVLRLDLEKLLDLAEERRREEK